MPDTPFRCRKCGSNKFVVPDHATDDNLVACADCGAGVGRWGDVRIGIVEEAKAVARPTKAKRRRAAA